MMEQNLLPQDISRTRLFPRDNETCAKIELLDHGGNAKQIFYVKGTWYPTHFMMSILDGEETWNFNGTQEFVLHEANALGMNVEEWLDQVHNYFCRQDVESHYSFGFVGPNSKMLQCSYFDKTGEKQSMKFLLNKISSCGEVAYQMLELLEDKYTKQQEELARKTHDIQQMVAEMHGLTSNLDEHFCIDHDSIEPLKYNRNSTYQTFQANSEYEKNYNNNNCYEEEYKDNKSWADTNAIKNIQHWTQDTNDDNPHPILRPLMDHQYVDELNMQNNFEGGEGSSIELFEEYNYEHDNIPLKTYEKNKSHDFSFVVPYHYVKGLLTNHSKKQKELQSKNDQETTYLCIAPKNIRIEKKVIVDVDFEENIVISKHNLYKPSIKCNKANWSLNHPILHNEIICNDHNSLHMIAKSSQNEISDHLSKKLEINDHLSKKLEILDQMPKFDNVSNNMNKIDKHLSYPNSPIKHESIVQQNKTSNIDDQAQSKVYFHHTTQNERKGKVYYKTPKHSYSTPESVASVYDDEEFHYEISNDVLKKKSYNTNKSNKNENSRWSSPSQLTLHDDPFDLITKSLFEDQNDKEINIKSNERVYTRNEDASKDILKNESFNIDPRISQVHWDSNSSLNQQQIPTNLIIHDIENINKPNNTYESIRENEYDSNHSIHPTLDQSKEQHSQDEHINWGENESNNNHSLENHPIHSTLHHPGQQHPHHEHIVWGENSINFGPKELQNTNQSIAEMKPSHIFHVEESLQPNEIINKELLSTTQINIHNNKDDERLQEIHEAPSTLDKILPPFQSHPQHDALESTSQNEVREKSVENPTNALAKVQSTKDIMSDNVHESMIDDTKETIHSNKNENFSKSPSFVQSFLSIFQSSSHATEVETSHLNENAIQNKESTYRMDDVNESKNSKNVDKSDDEVSIISTIFSTFHEPTSSQSSIVHNHTQGRDESKALNIWFHENETQDINVLDSSFENKSIDNEVQYNELPNRQMDAFRKASVDEVRKELLFKLGNQHEEEELEGMFGMKNVIKSEFEHDAFHEANENDELVDGNLGKAFESKKEETSQVLEQHTNREPRRYSIDKLDANKLKDMQQRSQSPTISRTSLYSNFRDHPSKSTINSQFLRTDEFCIEIPEAKDTKGIGNGARGSKDVENVQESQAKIYDQGSVSYSKPTFFDENDNEEDTLFDNNDNSGITNAFNDKVVETFMPSSSEISNFNDEKQRSNRISTLSTNDNNDLDKSVLCVARICFVNKSKVLSTLQNHATTSTSSTPINSNFNFGLQFNNEESQNYD